MEKRRINRPKRLILFVMLGIAAIASITFVLAKYVGTSDIEAKVALNDFDVELVDSNGDPLALDTYGTITLTAAEYENFTLSVDKTGDGWAYIRVLVEESWIEVASDGTETVMLLTTPPTSSVYTMGSDIVTNTTDSTDRYLYVDETIKDAATIPVISGSTSLPGDINSGNTAYKVKLSIKVDIIQYNRLEALWGSSTPLSSP